MTLETFVNISGNLRDVYKAAVPGSLRHVDQLMNERRTAVGTEQTQLRNNWFYTPDGGIYFMDGKNPKLAITREPDNLVLRHIDDAFTQLTTTQNYRPDVTEAQAAIHSASTLVVDLTQLKLQGNKEEWRYMAVSTTRYNKLTSEQRTFAERVYGQGADFAANMQMLKDARIDETKIFVLNPDYVREHAGKVPLARASWLCDINYNSNFLAGDRGVYGPGRVRGVVLGGARSAALEKSEVQEGQSPSEQKGKLSLLVPSAPLAPSEIRVPTLDDIIQYTTPFVADVSRASFEDGLRKLYKP